MDGPRLLVSAAVATILGVAVVSGPAVGLVDFTTPRFDGATIGQGNATIDRVEAPETARFERNIQSESYDLHVPDARIRVGSVSGQPTVSYKISIGIMEYTRGKTYFLDEGNAGWMTLSIDQLTFSPAEISRSSYPGNLTVTLRYNGTEQVVYDEPITVEVQE